MQMKINLDQIFGSSTTHETLHNSDYQSYQPSQSGSQQSYQNKYKIQLPIFDQQSQQVYKQGQVGKPSQNKTPSVVSIQTQYSDKTPGQRLYYQSKTTIARKKQQLQRLKLQKTQEQLKQATFKPKINKKSYALAQNRQKVPKINKKQTSKLIPTHVKKQQEQIMQCTFKPELISKSSSGYTRFKVKGQIFEQLFNDHKVKEVKKKLTNQFSQQARQQKKLTKAQFQGFLARNNQFKSKVQKKKQLIISTSTKFDLQTGNKLFSPQTNSFKSHKNYFSQKPSFPKTTKNIVQNFKTHSIFSKNKQRQQNNQEQVQQHSPEFRIKLTEQQKMNIMNQLKNKQQKTHNTDYDYENKIKGANIGARVNNVNVNAKINEEDQIQDEQFEVTDETPQFQTVKGLQFDSERQISRNKAQRESDQHQYINHDSQNQDEEQSQDQNLEQNQNQQFQSQEHANINLHIGDDQEITIQPSNIHLQSNDEQIGEQTQLNFNNDHHQYQQQNEQIKANIDVNVDVQQNQSPIKNQMDKNSDVGETQFGEESRYQDQIRE